MATSSNATPARSPRDEPSRSPPDERRQREARILDAAATLLIRWGYRKTTIDDVAREAGVGKGTIYLHWPDKNKLFSAAIARASRQTSADMMRRVTADPEGGQFHRMWTHGLLAVYANPLMSALMQGRSDIFQGLLDTLDPQTLDQLADNADAHIVQLQQAGLIRADIPVAVIMFLLGALKVGLINIAALADQLPAPAPEQLTEVISDLMRRWLDPEQPPGDSTVGKHITSAWLERSNELLAQP